MLRSPRDLRSLVLCASLAFTVLWAPACGRGRNFKKPVPPASGQTAPGQAAPAPAASTTPAPGTAGATPQSNALLRVEDSLFKDRWGRTVILRGVNVADSSKRPPFLPWQDESKWDLMQAWGVNCIRYLIEWQAIEPQPDQYDNAYLDEVAKRIQWSADRDMYVFLDMHQDVYANKYYWEGNGAPDWACLDKFRLSKIFPNMPWHMHYYDPGVTAAFESFWKDAKPAGSSRGIQTHYIDAWKFVAARFKNDPAVVGFDIMNEPFYGYRAYSIVMKGFRVQLRFLWKHIWPWIATPKYMMDLVKKEIHDNKNLYDYLDAMAPGFEEFDKHILNPFLQRTINAVRPVAPDWIAFVEPGMLKGGGSHAFIQDLSDAQGRPLTNLCYAPHYYDPTMAWVEPYDANIQRAEIAFDRIVGEAKRLNAAIVLGEWGGIENPPAAEMHIRDQLNLIERYQFGATWWDYRPKLETASWLGQWVRPYPRAVAGKLQEYQYDDRSRRFTLYWDEDPAVQSRVTDVFVPDLFHWSNGFVVDSYTDPTGSWTWHYDAKTRLLSIEADPNTASHSYYVDPK